MQIIFMGERAADKGGEVDCKGKGEKIEKKR